MTITIMITIAANKARSRLREAKLKRPRVIIKLVPKLQTCLIIN
jgi:hypothetical protein